jgi:hypothetical protein
MFCFCNYFCVCHCKKSMNNVWLQLFCVCDCNQNLCVVANMIVSVWLKLLVFLLFMIASLSSVWLQQRGNCDYKNEKHVQCLQTILCVSLQTLQVIFMITKKAWTVCVCNYFACVIATRSYLWLHHGSLCSWSYLVIWLFIIASLSSVWLQQQGRLWLQKKACTVFRFATTFLCHCDRW